MIQPQPSQRSKGKDLDITHGAGAAAPVQPSRVLITALTFGLFIILGIWSGSNAARALPVKGPMATLAAIAPPPTPANGQTNLLIIGVDRLNIHEPGLESIWLLGYFANRPHISLVPVYPSPTGPSIHRRAEIIGSIRLTADGHPSPDLIRFLRRERIWWNGYVILDAAGMIEIIDLLGGVQIGGQQLNGALAVGSFPPPSEDMPAALSGQTRLLRGMCSQIRQLDPSVDLRKLLILMPDHLRTDIDVFETVRIWRELARSGQDFVCDFPLLQASLP